MGGPASGPVRGEETRNLSSASGREEELLVTAETPDEIRDLLLGILDRAGLRGPPRLEVLEELLTHFQDGLAGGRSWEEVAWEFGDGALAGDLIGKSHRKSPTASGRLRHLAGRCREWAGSLSQDLKLVSRGLLRSPGFASLAILTTALGVGANTAVFSVVNGLLLQGLPYHDPGQLVVPVLTHAAQGIDRGPVGYMDLLRWREETGIFQSMGLWLDWNFNLTGEGRPERVRGAVVSYQFFQVLGVPLLAGRGFAADEHDWGSGKAALLSQGIWERRYGADPSVVGSTILLDEESYEVVGIVPHRAVWPRGAEIWIPLTFGTVAPPEWIGERDHLGYWILARLQEGVDVPQATAAANAIAERAALDRPDTRAGFGATVVPLRTWVLGDSANRTILLLMGSVALILLIGCANVANLTLERSLGRQKEIALRASLGAGRGRSVRPFVGECLLVAFLGGIVGVAISLLGIRALVGIAPDTIPGMGEIGVDQTVLVFGVAVSLLNGVLISLVPVVATGRIDLQRCLKDGGPRAGQGNLRNRARRTLALAQLTLSVVLVVGASLLGKSAFKLMQVDPGFEEAGLLTMKAYLPHRSPTAEAVAEIAALYGGFIRSLEDLPGALSASAGSALPLSADGSFDLLPFSAVGAESGARNAEHWANWNMVDLGFFETLGVPIFRGRPLLETDGEADPMGVVISESLAREMFPGEDPIGRRIRSTRIESPMAVVGVVGDIRYSDLADGSRNVVYAPEMWRAMALAVRFEGDPLGRTEEVLEAIWSVDPTVPVGEVRSMEELVSASFAAPRFAATLVGLFAALALTLALVGVYGVVNVSVRHRFHELGVRKALGADGAGIARLLLGEYGRMAAWGTGFGLLAAALLSRLLSSLLFQVSAHDLLVFLSVPLFLVGATLVAILIPARRAASIDPLEALKTE